jgi:predicted RNA binding protein YcfA (HicA-like mRNA interferase family)
MPKLRVLSGQDVIAIFVELGFTVFSQKGSHVKLRRSIPGAIQTLTVPNHGQLKKGTLLAIFRQASHYIDPGQLRPRFYSE